MSDDFIILPNGRKLYFNDEYGNVNADKLKNGSSDLIIWNYDVNQDGSLSQLEICSIFNAIKTKAEEDGNNKLSEKELKEFIKEEKLSAEEEEQFFNKIKANDIIKFLLNLQEESQKNLEQLQELEPTYDLMGVFPELSVLELGDDRHIDTSKLSFENIREKLFSDTERYEYTTETKTAIGVADSSGKVSPPFDYQVLKIVDKQTQKEVLSYDEVNQELLLLNKDNTTLIISGQKNEYQIHKISEKGDISLSNAKIIDGKLANVNYKNGNTIEYNNGVKSLLMTQDDCIVSFNSSGLEIRSVDTNGKFIDSKEAQTISEIINSETKADIQKLEQILTSSYNENRLAQSMDDYYTTTGRELIDDIKNSKLPEDVKTKFIKEMSEPFVESEYYNPNLSIESSQIKSKYYTGDDYSIKYNGPIIMVQNKNTGETTRINLKTLFKNYNFTHRGSKKMTDKLLAKDLKAIQQYSGEILENIGIELSSIKYEASRGLHKQQALAFYTEHDDSITTPEIYSEKWVGVMIHELGHAIDNITNENGEKSDLSSQGKFKERYDKYIEEWEAKGHKRFDFKHSQSLRRILMAIFKRTSDYGTYDENEAFAICLSGILGKPDPHFKYIEQNFPELIDLAKELYLEVRSLNQSQRNPKN